MTDTPDVQKIAARTIAEKVHTRPERIEGCEDCAVLAAAVLSAVEPVIRREVEEAQKTVAELLSSRDAWQRKHEEAMARNGQLVAEVAALRRERDLAVAHDRQPYPTSDAYEAACAALKQQRERADYWEEQTTEVTRREQFGQLRIAELQRDLAAVRPSVERMTPVVEAAKVRAQVVRDLAEYGSGAAGWYERDTTSDFDLTRAVDTYEAKENTDG